MSWGDGVAMAALSDGRPQLWAVSSDGTLWSTWYASTSWSDWRYWQQPWTPAAPPFRATAVAAAPLSDGRLEFWAVDGNGTIWSCWKSSIDPGSSWTAWTNTWTPVAPTFTAAAVCAAQLSDTRVQVWAVDGSGAIWTCWKTSTDSSSAWSAWTNSWTPGPPAFTARAAIGAIAAAPLSDARLQFWAVDAGGAIWTCWKTTADSSSAWSAWTRGWTPGAPAFRATAIAVAPLSDGRLQFWALDGGGALWSCWKSGNAASSWTAWTTGWIAGAAPFSARAVAASIAGNITAVLAVDAGGMMWSTNKVSTSAGDSWTPWALQFEMERQEQTNWCWSACATATSRFYDPSSGWTQCSLAGKAVSGNCCANPGPCNQGWYLDQALGIVGHLDHQQGGTVPQGTIAAETAAGRPLGVRQAWDGGGAHFIMVVGGSDGVVVHDPWYGPTYIPYATLVHGYQGSGTWTDSYFTR